MPIARSHTVHTYQLIDSADLARQECALYSFSSRAARMQPRVTIVLGPDPRIRLHLTATGEQASENIVSSCSSSATRCDAFD